MTFHTSKLLLYQCLKFVRYLNIFHLDHIFSLRTFEFKIRSSDYASLIRNTVPTVAELEAQIRRGQLK
jgi:hypothetical protein